MEGLKVRVCDIQADGLDSNLKFPATDLGLENVQDIHFADPIQVSFHLEKVSNTVIAHAIVKTQITSSCSRCLEPAEETLKQDLHFTYPIEKQTDYVDLSEDIRQEIIMQLPIQLLCNDNCKGLCPQCGGNKNIQECQCKSFDDKDK